MTPTADRCLRELNLPSSLDALERPVGLPPSLLRKAEEVRIGGGVAKIETWIESVQMLAQHVIAILDEVRRHGSSTYVLLILSSGNGYFG